MKALEDMIMEKGNALSDSVLKVDSFINHQVDPKLMKKIAESFAEYYKDSGVTRVLTIESSGIAPAVMTAALLSVPMVILKKQIGKILMGDVYQCNITSFTKGTSYELTLSADYINADDNVLIIDDFLANGEAASGAVNLARMGGAKVTGVGILIEKSFQKGRKRLEDAGIEVCSLARIENLSRGQIILGEADA